MKCFILFLGFAVCVCSLIVGCSTLAESVKDYEVAVNDPATSDSVASAGSFVSSVFGPAAGLFASLGLGIWLGRKKRKAS